MWKERVIWALLADPSQPLLSNVFSIVNTSSRNHDMDIANERVGKSTTSMTYSASCHSSLLPKVCPSLLFRYYKRNLRQSKSPLPASLSPDPGASWQFATKPLMIRFDLAFQLQKGCYGILNGSHLSISVSIFRILLEYSTAFKSSS